MTHFAARLRDIEPFQVMEVFGRARALEAEGRSIVHMEVGEPDQFAAALEASREQESFRLRMQLKTLLFGLGETFQVLIQRKLSK